ncbi:phage tail protein [Burkholderia sp. Ac-20379]|uniref:phage tail protein n=1 Tax=Burkholderia sp. Ac-20379 TaxID=2703900 RepID=UPI00197EA1D9|nr:phage tail protein [Burkholderia sp. Ac-20379]MBN3725624.1 phage tail protein [Burkholderia sp. Ac-20379]
MNKPAALRAAIVAAVPSLAASPDSLLMSINAGAIAATGTGTSSFDYDYECEINLWAGVADIDTVMIAVLDWVRANQADLVMNPDRRRDGITFFATLPQGDRVNLDLKLRLSESVLVRVGDDGKRVVQYVDDSAAVPIV